MKNNHETQKILKRIQNFSASRQNIITQKIQLELGRPRVRHSNQYKCYK